MSNVFGEEQLSFIGLFIMQQPPLPLPNLGGTCDVYVESVVLVTNTVLIKSQVIMSIYGPTFTSVLMWDNPLFLGLVFLSYWLGVQPDTFKEDGLLFAVGTK